MAVRAIALALIFTAFSLTPRTARADDESANPYFTLGFILLAGSISSDTVQWALIGTTSESAHWLWHLVPVAGPLIGIEAFGASHCKIASPEPQCNPLQPLVQGLDALYLAGEVTGLALVVAGFVKRTQPRYTPASFEGMSTWTPKLAVTPSSFSVGFAKSF